MVKFYRAWQNNRYKIKKSNKNKKKLKFKRLNFISKKIDQKFDNFKIKSFLIVRDIKSVKYKMPRVMGVNKFFSQKKFDDFKKKRCRFNTKQHSRFYFRYLADHASERLFYRYLMRYSVIKSYNSKRYKNS